MLTISLIIMFLNISYADINIFENWKTWYNLVSIFNANNFNSTVRKSIINNYTNE